MNGINQEHVALVAKNHAKHSIRGGTGLIFALLTILAGLMIGSIILDPISQIMEEGVEAGATAEQVNVVVEEITNDVARPVIQWATDASDTQLDYWLVDNPGLISAFLMILAIFVPFFACLGAFNQLSGDIGSRGIRYLLLRTERSNLFIGRFVGTFLFSLIVYAFLFMIMTLFFMFKIDFYDKGDVVLWMLRGFLVVSIYALPFVAFSAWISSAIDSPFGSLAMSYLFVGGIPLLIWIAGNMNEHAGKASYILPNAYKQWLFDPNIGKALAGGAIMCGFTAVFLFLGMRHFERRDL